MNLRWILCRQSHPNPILRIPLYPTLYYCSTSNSPCPIPTRNRIKQPIRNQFRFRQNPIPPILYYQRLLWISTLIFPSPDPSTILTRPIRRPRQLHTSQPLKHTTTH
uniref:Uncharacterized protein n=1 Tax=Castor canadensis TaxID=51338 RepID=A0A8C0VYH7_CASCN